MATHGCGGVRQQKPLLTLRPLAGGRRNRGTENSELQSLSP